MLSLFTNTAYAAEVQCAICDKIVTNIFNPIVAVLFGLAFVYFLYGMLEFIQGGSNDKAVEKGKLHMIYGILGLVIMVGVNGIVQLIKDAVATFTP